MSGARIQLKRSTAASWTSNNPVLYVGEIGFETDTKKLKIGDGSTAWTSLSYTSVPIALSALNDLADVTITSAADGDFLRWNGTAWINDAVNLSTDTIGSYVASLVAGTGVTLTNNSGEGATPTVAVTANTFDAFGAASTAATNAATALTNHEADTTSIHGIADTSILVTTTGTQTLTNKTITSPSGLVKGDVGLGNVDNTADTAKPVSTAQQTAFDLKANLASPTFTGTVTVPTPIGDTTAATKLYVDTTASTTASNAATALTNHEADTTNIHGIADTSILVTTTGSQTLTNKTITSPSGLVKGDVGLGNVDNTSNATERAASATLTNKTLTSPVVNTPTGIVKGDVGLGSVDNTADTAKPVSTAQQTALDLKATLASPTFTGTVAGITKTMVGLGSVDNTADTAKPVSTAQQTALDLKAPLASPTLTGTPIAPTATAGNNSTQIATTAYADAAVAAIIDSAPATLNTLNELADALGDDPSFATTVSTSIGLKAPIASPTFTGTVTIPTGASITAPTGLVKGDVGLGNTDNTSDANKPVSTAQQTALDLKAPLASPTFTGTVSGITATMVGLGSVDNTADTAKPVSTAQQTALDLKANLASPTFTGTVSGISKTMVGLGSADNTTDAAKPVSTATQTALDLKAPLASPTFTGTVTIPSGASISGFAPLASPSLTGTPLAPTATSGTNTTQIATTAFVATALSGATITSLDDVADVTITTIYAIGDTGPAGGKIFITPSTAGNSTGKYFEAAPFLNPDVTRTWATNANSNQSTAVSGADGTAIGTGAQNTTDIVAQSGNIAATCAAAYASDYTYGGFSDWFLPSRNELTELYTNRASIGGFSTAESGGEYWSSSEYSSSQAYFRNFTDGTDNPEYKYDQYNYVRPVRSFTAGSSATSGQFLKWNGTAWVNDAVPIISNIDDITGVTITSAADKDFLMYNGTAWVDQPITLGTDTSGNYMANVSAGPGITVTHTAGEGSTATISARDSLIQLYMEVI